MVEDLSCASDDDCCVVSDPCRTMLYLTNRVNSDSTGACLSVWYADTQCMPCAPRPVQVWCDNGTCRGDYAYYIPGLDRGHCGWVEPPEAGGEGSGGGAGTSGSEQQTGGMATESTGGTMAKPDEGSVGGVTERSFVCM